MKHPSNLALLALNTKILGIQIIVMPEKETFSFLFTGCPLQYEKNYRKLFNETVDDLMDHIINKLLTAADVTTTELELAKKIIFKIIQKHGFQFMEKAMQSLSVLDADLMTFSIELRVQMELACLGYVV